MMNKISVINIIFTLFVIYPVFAEDEKKLLIPPNFYIDKSNPCPFECCSYGNWTIETPVKGYKKPDANSNVVGEFKEGNIASVTKGEIHVSPGQFLISNIARKEPIKESYLPIYKEYYESHKVGGIIPLYTYIGEGFYKTWFKGHFLEVDPRSEWVDGDISVEPKSTWWVYAKSPHGWSGWTNETHRFSGNNQCPSAYPWHIRMMYNTEDKRIRTPNELNNFKILQEKLGTLNTIKFWETGYSLNTDQLDGMYIDIGIMDLHTMEISKKYTSIKELAQRVVKITKELGIHNKIMLDAMCLNCKINSSEYEQMVKYVRSLSTYK